MQIVSHLGMKRFTVALMYVLRKVCGMSEDLLLCPASVEGGQILLNEILTAGNFGHDDPRMASLNGKEGHLRYQIKHAWR